jgi:hypothetical protein
MIIPIPNEAPISMTIADSAQLCRNTIGSALPPTPFPYASHNPSP